MYKTYETYGHYIRSFKKDSWSAESNELVETTALQNPHLSAPRIARLPELSAIVGERGEKAVTVKVIKIRRRDLMKRRQRSKKPKYNIQQITIGGDVISLPYVSCLDERD